MSLLDRLLRSDRSASSLAREALGRAMGPRGGRPIALSPLDRLDGRTALLAASREPLGRALAAELFARGCHVILATDRGRATLADEVRQRSQALTRTSDASIGKPGTLEVLALERRDRACLEAVANELAEDGVALDVLVLCLDDDDGSPRGRDELAPWLAYALLARTLLARGVVVNGVFAERFEDDPVSDARRFRPRVVIASSGDDASDRALRGWARGLGERLLVGGDVEVAVHVCSTKEPIEGSAEPTLLGRLFARGRPRADEGLARDLAWLACARPLEGRTGVEVRDGSERPLASAARPDERAFERVEALLGAASSA